ncbi:MAG: DUF4339 domain-containing protein [Salinibacter sp.]|uniref:DUF4339 domain-containing protein n=1 Tax=Salinibacter sp. TaxID=2065818 RepID=UPI0035D527D4
MTDPTSDAKWYWSKRDSDGRNGPVDWNQLKELVRNGDLDPKDLVHAEGMDGWREIGSVDGFVKSKSPPPGTSDVEDQTSSLPRAGGASVSSKVFAGGLLLCALIDLFLGGLGVFFSVVEGLPENTAGVAVLGCFLVALPLGGWISFLIYNYFRGDLKYDQVTYSSSAQSSLFAAFLVLMYFQSYGGTVTGKGFFVLSIGASILAVGILTLVSGFNSRESEDLRKEGRSQAGAR